MFNHARIKLTGFYLLIILIISGLFSFSFYHASTREIDRIIQRLEFEKPWRQLRPALGPKNPPSIEELLAYKTRVVFALLLVNGLILVIAGVSGYFLAGRTLKPIRQMVDEQNQFVSDASHELRTPMATMRAQMEGQLLEKRISDTQARKLISSNLEELSRLQSLANNLLKLSSTYRDNQNSPRQKIVLADVIETAVKKMTPLAKKKSIKIQTNIQPVSLIGNQDNLIDLMVILLDNAIKYSPAKSEIIITVNQVDHKAKLTVTDQGMGIPPQDLPYIFDRFYRADKSRSQADGHGLGLAIAQKIVQSHKGTISVTSHPHQGTTFQIIFPLIKSV